MVRFSKNCLSSTSYFGKKSPQDDTSQGDHISDFSSSLRYAIHVGRDYAPADHVTIRELLVILSCNSPE